MENKKPHKMAWQARTGWKGLKGRPPHRFGDEGKQKILNERETEWK
jgi:hypothetical protein